ncbi:hypothetical protein CEXT_88811 [Caerostris extrusa]|uniref:Uncharacterized protein n=1 Tax=Caerostris extrusa TaxID=172846 RepID=A0AAV4XVQ0_CAEEX|nr:hypothetical protein CEXT_88811 [Caerostris extrusa]
MVGAGRATRHFYYEGKPAKITYVKKKKVPEGTWPLLNDHFLELRCVRQMMMAFNHRLREKLSFWKIRAALLESEQPTRMGVYGIHNFPHSFSNLTKRVQKVSLLSYSDDNADAKEGGVFVHFEGSVIIALNVTFIGTT